MTTDLNNSETISDELNEQKDNNAESSTFKPKVIILIRLKSNYLLFI